MLQKYQVAPEAWLSSGMEAEVYTFGPDAVLKLYAGTASRFVGTPQQIVEQMRPFIALGGYQGTRGKGTA